MLMHSSDSNHVFSKHEDEDHSSVARMLYHKQFDKLIGAICLPAVHQKDPFSPNTTLLMQIDNMTELSC